METYPNSRHSPYAPTETADLYPESDGKPMAEAEAEAEVSRLHEEIERLKARLSDD